MVPLTTRFAVRGLSHQRWPTRRAAAAEEARRGKYCLAETAAAAKASLVDEMLSFWDAALVELADGQAAEFGLPRDDVRALFREIGARARSEALQVANRRK